MASAGVIGIARVVIHNQERLAALVAEGDALLLNTIRWAEEIRPRSEIAFPPAAKPKEGEMKMAVQLIRDMSGAWKPSDYADKFTHAIHALAAQRVKAGKTEKVTSLEGDATPATSNVVDLAELLKKSLETRKPSAHRAKADATATQASAARTVGRKAAPARPAKAAKARRAA
jgi:DNA end-binding protein Ku